MKQRSDREIDKMFQNTLKDGEYYLGDKEVLWTSISRARNEKRRRRLLFIWIPGFIAAIIAILSLYFSVGDVPYGTNTEIGAITASTSLGGDTLQLESSPQSFQAEAEYEIVAETNTSVFESCLQEFRSEPRNRTFINSSNSSVTAQKEVLHETSELATKTTYGRPSASGGDCQVGFRDFSIISPLELLNGSALRTEKVKLSMPIQDDEESMEGEKRRTAYHSFGLIYSFRTLSSKVSPGISIREESVFSMGGSYSRSFELKNNWHFLIGLEYIFDHNRYSLIIETKQRDLIFDEAYALTDLQGVYHTYNDSLFASRIERFVQVRGNSSHRINLPIGFGYHRRFESWTIGSNFGVNINVVQHYSGSIASIDEELVNVNEWDYFNKDGHSAFLSCLIARDLNKSGYELFLNPQCRWRVRSMSPRSTRAVERYALNLTAGIRIRGSIF